MEYVIQFGKVFLQIKLSEWVLRIYLSYKIANTPFCVIKSAQKKHWIYFSTLGLTSDKNVAKPFAKVFPCWNGMATFFEVSEKFQALSESLRVRREFCPRQKWKQLDLSPKRVEF